MNLWTMRAAAIGWLRFEQRCFLVATERSPVATRCRPDIIGVLRDRRFIEIELKRSKADFVANAAKHSIRWRLQTGVGLPFRFYFAVPPTLVPAVQPLLQPDEGLLTFGEPNQFGPTIRVIVPARHCSASARLSKYEIARMVMHQTATLHRAAVALSNCQSDHLP